MEQPSKSPGNGAPADQDHQTTALDEILASPKHRENKGFQSSI
jgi:hypothetical protein